MNPSPRLILRQVYFDEAGLANEPYTVVGGMMLHVDNQYLSVQKYILDMADDLVGPNRPPDFAFQAKQLWHGEGHFPRDKWPRLKRLEILGHLADIPKKFAMPVIYSCVERAPYFNRVDLSKSPTQIRRERARILKHCHAICFMSALSQADKWVAQFHSDENVFAVVENHADHKNILLATAQFFSNPRVRTIFENDPNVRWKLHGHIVEEPLFMRKSGSSPLQVADTCAFVLSRALAGSSYSEPLLERLKPMLVRGFVKKFFLDESMEQFG